MSFEDAYKRGVAKAREARAQIHTNEDEDVTHLGAYAVEQAALEAHDAGICAIRAATDGTKKPLGEWKRWQAEMPTREQVGDWFGDGHEGLGLVTGEVSGGLELFEFEGAANRAGIVRRFKEAIREAGLEIEWDRIRKGYSERTPGDGFHVLWRCDTIAGNTKLARRLDPESGETQVLIETRGEGGFVIVAPSCGGTHPTGRPWVRRHGSFATVATIHPELRNRILEIARSFDELPDEEPERAKPLGEKGDGGMLPGFDLGHEEILKDAGFEHHHTDRKGNVHWTRPGKDAREGSSLTVWADDGRATPWSTSITMPGEFITGQRLLTPWQLYVALNYGGDFTAAGREWREEHPNVTVTSLDSLVSPSHTQEWPTLHADALYGPIGQAVEFLEPHTEADPAAVLATLLTGWGAILGKGPHASAGHVQHPARLSVAIVGETAKARKGTSWATALTLLEHVDPHYMLDRVLGGFGSGESVVDEVRDAQPSDDPEKEGDPGASDKRLLIHEPEFARILKVCARESSVLSTIIRDAWDGSRLQARARTRRAVATGHHIAMVGHITAPELRRNLNETEIAGGFANRILWICARRSKLLPFGDSLSPIQLSEVGMILKRAREAATSRGCLTFTPEARELWSDLYERMAKDDPGGLLGAIVARPEPQCLRLALIYALLDQAKGIGPAHIGAAWALWTYSRDSASYIWGDAVGDEIADTLLRAFKKAGTEGLDRTAQSALFSRKVEAKRLSGARAELERRGLIETLTEQTGGRPRVIDRVLAKQTKEAKEGTT